MSFFNDLLHGITPEKRRELDRFAYISNARKEFRASLNNSQFAKDIFEEIYSFITSSPGKQCLSHEGGIVIRVYSSFIQWTEANYIYSDGPSYCHTIKYKERGYIDLWPEELVDDLSSYLKMKFEAVFLDQYAVSSQNLVGLSSGQIGMMISIREIKVNKREQLRSW